MRVNKFRAKTIKEAIASVKKVLGPDALILSTKKVAEGGCDNYVEILAMIGAVDISNSYPDMLGDVRQELMTIKEMLCLLNNSDVFLEKIMMQPNLLNLYSSLIKNGVHDRHVRFFIEKSGGFNGHSTEENNSNTDKTLKEIMNVISVKDPFDFKNNRQILSAFIGTTGVGKTTTIAKLAAALMFEKNKKVGLISMDAYRIGAMEQLKTYANILEVPCFQAFNKKDLLFALRRMDGKDVILIDTAGQSQYDMLRIEELKSLIQNDLDIGAHLLLSIPTQEPEMNKTALNFKPLKYQSYIFTKRDEAQRCGSIVNQIMELNLPISYITTGQNVPDDIEQADKRKILELIT